MDLSEKIYLAGSNGMVGSAIKRQLIINGYGKEDIGGKIFCPSSSELNLLNFNELKDWFEVNKPTIIIIAAAKVGGILANSKYPYQFIFNNIQIQTNLIEIARLFKVKKILFLGVVVYTPNLLNSQSKRSIYWMDT